jgi:hypothetical protein
MADYYFRNTGNNAWEVTTNWSASDGGPSIGAVPAVTDNVFFTANSGPCNVNSAIVIANITFSSSIFIFTIAVSGGSLNVTDTMQISAGGVSFGGAGWTTRNYINLSTTGNTTTLTAGYTYTVNGKYIRSSERGSAHGKVVSSIGGTKAILTVKGEINLGYVDFTDIDASAGRPLYTFNGVVTNCINISTMSDKPATTQASGHSVLI